MSNGAKIAAGAVGAIVVLMLFLSLPLWVKLALIAVPVGGYLMLDASQRRRLRSVTRRQIGR